MVPARSRTLDIIRAVAVLLVMARHLVAPPPDTSPWALAFTNALMRGGWVGVDLFFVLSGFLVSGLLFEEHTRTGRLSVGRFLARRGFKIYPPFYFVILCTVLLSTAGIHGRSSGAQLGAELLLVQNYLPGLWSHTWSLAVEEHFYLLLPVLLLALLACARSRGEAADSFRQVPALFLVAAAICLALRLRMALTAPYSHATHLFPTHLRIDSLFLGVVLSYWRHYRAEWFFATSRRYRAAMVTLGTLCFLPAFLYTLETTWLIPSIGLSLCALGGGMLLWGLAGVEPSRSRLARAAAWVGARSYSVYLWHVPFLVWGFRALMPLHPQLTWIEGLVIYVVGSVLVGLAMHALIEAPMLRLRDRLVPSRTRTTRQTPTTGPRLTPVTVSANAY